MKTVLLSWIRSLSSRLPSKSTVSSPSFPIGLDMGPRRLNLVQMMTRGSRVSLRAIASVPYEGSRDELLCDPQALKALFKHACSMQPFKGKRVVSCLPADQIKIISLSYRHTEGQTDDAAIIAELRSRLQDELDTMVVDYLPLRQEDVDAGKRDALVALAPREQVLAYLNLLTRAGLQVDALDIGPAALTRLVRHVGMRQSAELPLRANALLINFGAESSYLTVIWGRRTVMDRAVEFSENRLLGRLKLVLDMPAELAVQLLYRTDTAGESADDTNQMVAEVFRPELALLHQEISKTLVYMASRTRGKSVDVVFLAGPLARHAGLVKSLQQQLKVPINILDPVTDFAAGVTRDFDESLGTAAGVALAAGLALRGVPDNE